MTTIFSIPIITYSCPLLITPSIILDSFKNVFQSTLSSGLSTWRSDFYIKIKINVQIRGAEYTRLRQRSWGNFLISRDVLGKWLGEKNRRWGKFLEIKENSAPLVQINSKNNRSRVQSCWIRKENWYNVNKNTFYASFLLDHDIHLHRCRISYIHLWY